MTCADCNRELMDNKVNELLWSKSNCGQKNIVIKATTVFVNAQGTNGVQKLVA